MPNWGAAYEQEIQETRDELRAARNEARYNKRTGARAHVWVPSEDANVYCEDLTDSDIREVAQREAEKYTQHAINQLRNRNA